MRRHLLNIGLIALALLSAGCTQEMRKARYASRAERYFKAGEWDQAKIEYLKLIQVDQKNSPAFARMGQIWADEGDPVRAGAFLVRARDLAPKDVQNRLNLARVYQSIGQFKEAFTEAGEALKQAPENGEALLVSVQSTQQDQQAAAGAELERFAKKESAHWKLASAVTAYRKNDLAQAETLLAQAQAADSTLPEVHSVAAMVALSKKDVARGREELKAAADLTPLRSREKRTYADYLLSIAPAEAAIYAKGLTDKARDFIAAWVVQAKAAMANRKYDEANSLLENVFSRAPDNLEARLTRAQILLLTKETKQATDALQSLDRSFPNSPLIKYQLAGAYLQGNNVAQATTELQQLLAAFPGQIDATVLSAQLQLKTGNAAAALAPLETIVKNQPDLVPARLLLADVYRAVGRQDAAANLLREQISKNPKDSNSHLFLGLALVGQQKTAEARQEFEQAVAANPTNALAVDQLVSLDVQEKKFAEAHASADAFVQAAPDSGAGYFMRARAFAGEGNFNQTEASLKKAIEKDPNLGPAYDLLVSLYVSNNKLPQALAELDEVLKKNPRNVAALIVTALVQERVQDFAKARDAYEKLLAVDPNSVVALNNLAYLFLEKFPDLKRAAELAKKAHDIAPGEASVTDTLGWVLYKQGDYPQAAEVLRQASAKAPGQPLMTFHVGMAEYMMGRREEAKAALQKAVSAPDDFPGKDEARQRLTLLSQGGPGGPALSATELEKFSNSNDPIALRQLGAAYEKEGNAQKAVAAYEKVIQANPRLPDVMFALANLYAGSLHDNARALEYGKKARDLNPTDARVTASVGGLALRAGNFPWAYSLLQESARQLPDDLSVAHDFAWAAYNSGKPGEAQIAMARAVNASDPMIATDAKRFVKLVPADALEKGNISSQEIEQALATDPNYTPALMAKAASLVQNSNGKAAAEIYTALLQRLPDFAPAQKRLAGIYAEDPSMLEKAADLAAKARRALGDDPELARINGAINFQKKEYSRAVQALQAAAGKTPLDVQSLYYLGKSQQATGRKSEAKESLSKALAAGLKGPAADDARRAVSELEKP